MKSVSDLTKGDYIAFGFNFNGGKPNEIIIDNITEVDENEVLVHFVYGHHALAEFIKKENILAIENPQGESNIRGWKGKYDILNQKEIDRILSK